jgi:hypothetical protein
MCLYSTLDYTVGDLRDKAEKVNFTNIKSSYMIAFSFLLVTGFRMLSKIRKNTVTEKTSYVEVSDLINNLFISFLKLEAKIQRHVRMPIGTSVLARFMK